MEYIIIEDPIPAGAEVVETEDYTNNYGYWRGCYARKEVRDEKIVYFITRLYSDSCIMQYTLRAESPGIYNVMPASAYNMYAPEISGASETEKFIIRDTPEVRIHTIIPDVNDDNKLRVGIAAVSIDEINNTFKMLDIKLIDPSGNILGEFKLDTVNLNENLSEFYLNLTQGYSALVSGSYLLLYSVDYGNETISGIKPLRIGCEFVNNSGTKNETFNRNAWNNKGVRYSFAGKPSAKLNISLHTGWNLISMPVEPEKLKIKEVFRGLNVNVTYYVVYKGDNGSWEWYYSEWDEGAFSKFKMGKGYYIYINDNVSENISLELEGLMVHNEIKLINGWNMMGPSVICETDINTVVKQIEGKYKYILYRNNAGEWKYYHHLWGANGLSDFAPGKGYFIYMTENGSIVV